MSVSFVTGAFDDGAVPFNFLAGVDSGELGNVLFERRKLDDGLIASFCFLIILTSSIFSFSYDGISEFCGTGTLPNSASSILLKYNSRAVSKSSSFKILFKINENNKLGGMPYDCVMLFSYISHLSSSRTVCFLSNLYSASLSSFSL